MCTSCVDGGGCVFGIYEYEYITNRLNGTPYSVWSVFEELPRSSDTPKCEVRRWKGIGANCEEFRKEYSGYLKTYHNLTSEIHLWDATLLLFISVHNVYECIYDETFETHIHCVETYRGNHCIHFHTGSWLSSYIWIVHDPSHSFTVSIVEESYNRIQ